MIKCSVQKMRKGELNLVHLHPEGYWGNEWRNRAACWNLWSHNNLKPLSKIKKKIDEGKAKLCEDCFEAVRQEFSDAVVEVATMEEELKISKVWADKCKDELKEIIECVK